MPTKRYVSYPANRASLLEWLAKTEASLKDFNAVFYHFATEKDPERIEGQRIEREFKKLSAKIRARIPQAKTTL
jgi:hypothetical protein